MLEPTAMTARVHPMIRADLALASAWRHHPDVRRSVYTQHQITLDEHQRWFERTLLNPKKHLLIFEVNHQPLGFVNFDESERGGVAVWGFYAAPDAPKGSERQFGCVALNHAFTQLKLHKVCGQALVGNERSIKFHQSRGFEQEDILCDQHFDGERYHNVICFGLLCYDWQPNR